MVFLRPKNKEKCRLIVNDKKLHAADNRQPPPIPTTKARRAGKVACLDGETETIKREEEATAGVPDEAKRQHCYWSIKLPRAWRKVFIIGNGRKRYRITRLPFGWR